MEQTEWMEWRGQTGDRARTELQKLAPGDKSLNISGVHKKQITQLVSSDFLSIVGGRIEGQCPVCKGMWPEWREHLLQGCLSRGTVKLGSQSVEALIANLIRQGNTTKLKAIAQITGQWILACKQSRVRLLPTDE